MKTMIALSILFCATTLPVLGELTDADLDKIRLIVKEEVKTEITASEKRTKEYIDLKIDAVNARIDVLEESLNARIDVTNTRIDYVDEGFDPFLVTVIVLVVSTLLLPIVIALVYGKLM